MTKIRIFIFAALAAFAMVATMTLAPATSAQSNRSEESFERTLPLSSGGSFRVENYKGKIEITAWDQNQVKINVTKYVVGNNESRQRWMQDTKIDFSQSTGRVGVKVEYENRNCWMGCDDNDIEESGVELKIQVPRSVNLAIDGYKPDLSISGTRGDLNIKSYKSDMHIERIQGPVHIDTYKNRIEMRNVDVQGELYIKTYSGEVDADITGIGSGATFDTYKGEVTLHLPDSAGMNIDFSDSKRGNFQSDFPVTINQGFRSSSIRGPINGGGPTLHFETYRGTLTLRKK